MKKHYALGLVTAFVAALGLATAAPAMATDCVPKDAWVEHIDHPAVGEPKITVDNPDYKPATPDTTSYVHHDGTPDTTEVTGYMKWTWTAGKHQTPESAPPSDGWHQVGVTSDSKGNTPDTIIHQGGGYGSYFYFETQTKVTPGTPAWDEPIVTPGTPAVGEPTISIDNPDYKASWVEDVKHDAVYCPANPGPQPNTIQWSTVIPSVVTCDGWTESTVKTYEISYVLNDEGTKWVPTPTKLVDTHVFPGFDATWDEKAQIDCARPAEVHKTTNTVAATCDAIGQTTESTVTTPWLIEDYMSDYGPLKKYVTGTPVTDVKVLSITPKKDCTTPAAVEVTKVNATPSNTVATAPVSANTLAETGSNATWVPLTAIGAISLIGLGMLLAWFRRKKAQV